MKPKRFASPHIVRLWLEDEEKLKDIPGPNAAAKLRQIVHEYFRSNR
jgi:hypothetical protein